MLGGPFFRGHSVYPLLLLCHSKVPTFAMSFTHHIQATTQLDAKYKILSQETNTLLPQNSFSIRRHF